MKKRNYNKSRNKNGYSIIEVIIALQIFMIVLSFAYTLYHYQHRFMKKWNEDSLTMNTSIVVDHLLFEISQRAKEIILIEQQTIHYIDDSGIKKLTCKNDNLFLNSKQVNTDGIKINITISHLYYSFQNSISEYTLTQKDLDRDGVIKDKELNGLSAILLNIKFKNQKKDFVEDKIIQLNIY